MNKKIKEVFNTVCEMRGFTPEQCFLKTRKREIVNTRQIAMYFCWEHRLAGLQLIGETCGGKDHSTTLHAHKTVKNLLETDKNFKAQYQIIESEIKKNMRKKIVDVDLSEWGFSEGMNPKISISESNELKLCVMRDTTLVCIESKQYLNVLFLRDITYLDELQLLYLGLTGEELKKV